MSVVARHAADLTHSARRMVTVTEDAAEAARMNGLHERLSGRPRRTLTEEDVQRIMFAWYEGGGGGETLHSFLGWSHWELRKYQLYGALPE